MKQKIEIVTKQDPILLMSYKEVVAGATYSLNKSFKDFRYVFLKFSCSASGNLANEVIFPTSILGKASNALMLHNYISSNINASAQVGFPENNKFVVGYLENKNVIDEFKKFYVTIYGIL